MLYSVTFSPDDPEFPSEEIARFVSEPGDVVQVIYSDIHTKRRPFYISPSAYRIAVIDDEDDNNIVEFISGEEFMATHNLAEPTIHAGMYVRTPRWLPGKLYTKYQTCEITTVNVERNRGSKWFALTELTLRGPSKDITRRHLIRYEDAKHLYAFRVWTPTQTAPGQPSTWILKSVERD